MREFIQTRLVKSEDLNHHGTLFAGRMAEWFIESTFIAAASTHGNPEEIVCVKLHGLHFTGPAKKGEILTTTTRLVLAGTTSLTVYGAVSRLNETRVLVDGFATFVCVDAEGRKKPHGICLPPPEDDTEAALRDRAVVAVKS